MDGIQCVYSKEFALRIKQLRESAAEAQREKMVKNFKIYCKKNSFTQF